MNEGLSEGDKLGLMDGEGVGLGVGSVVGVNVGVGVGLGVDISEHTQVLMSEQGIPLLALLYHMLSG